MQSELNGTKNLNLPPPAAETQGEVMLTEPANSHKETSASRKRTGGRGGAATGEGSKSFEKSDSEMPKINCCHCAHMLCTDNFC